MSISVFSYGLTRDEKPIELYRLRNEAGMEVDLMNYGATIVSIKTLDHAGQIGEVTLGYDTLAEWENGRSFFGGIVGRFGNRLAHGRFMLDGVVYQVPTNDGPHALHGGAQGFHQRVWKAEILPTEGGSDRVRFRYISPDGEQGFPGTLTTEVTYSLSVRNELHIDYRVTTDAPTILNLTNHVYFDLDGDHRGSILGHTIRIDADRFVVTDARMIPTGELLPVAGTPMDLRTPQRIGAHIDEKFPPLMEAGGYDHTYVLNGSGLREVAEVSSPTSGRVLTVLTTEPGMQFYSGNFLANEAGRHDRIYPRRSGFCLETQHFPDSPNHPQFPSTVIRPNEILTSQTIYRFSTKTA